MTQSSPFRKKIAFVCLLLFLSFLLQSCSDKPEEPPPLDSVDKQFSYVMGYEAVGVIENLDTTDLDKKSFLNGIKDALAKKAPRINREQGLHIKSLVFEKEREHKNQQAMQATDKNRQRQKRFLEKNRKKEEVVTTASGLQYKILKKGDGPRPTPSDRVKVHIKGTLLDGTVFDSSYADGTPLVGPVKGDIPVWEEALTLMRVGARYKFFVPSKLAYGEKGDIYQGGNIGPNQMIILELELLDILESSEKQNQSPDDGK